MDTAKKMIRSNFKEEWMQSWISNNTGRALFQHMNAPKKNDPINQLPNADCAVFTMKQ